jgi:hypothetical protein
MRGWIAIAFVFVATGASAGTKQTTPTGTGLVHATIHLDGSLTIDSVSTDATNAAAAAATSLPTARPYYLALGLPFPSDPANNNYMFLSDTGWGMGYTIFAEQTGEIFTNFTLPFSFTGFVQILNQNGCFTVSTGSGPVFLGCFSELIFDGHVGSRCAADGAGRGLIGDWNEVTTFTPANSTATTISNFTFFMSSKPAVAVLALPDQVNPFLPAETPENCPSSPQTFLSPSYQLPEVPGGQSIVVPIVFDAFCGSNTRVGQALVDGSWSAVPDSGGHIGHDETAHATAMAKNVTALDSSTIDMPNLAYSGTSDSFGRILLNVEAGEATGDLKFGAAALMPIPSDAAAVFGDGTLTVTTTPGFSELAAGSNVVPGGRTTAHPENHFGTSTTFAAIQTFADLIQNGSAGLLSAFPEGLCLDVNDISLAPGGIFDLDKAFDDASGHCTHRRGIDFDSLGLHDCLTGHLFGGGSSSLLVASAVSLPSGLTVKQIENMMAQHVVGAQLVPADEGPVHFRVIQ